MYMLCHNKTTKTKAKRQLDFQLTMIPEAKLHFPGSFAARCGHTNKWLNDCMQRSGGIQYLGCVFKEKSYLCFPAF